jgi:hypothetical protein
MIGNEGANNIRAAVRGVYDIQKLRIQMGNRICMNFKTKLGQDAGQKEEDMEAAAQFILEQVRASYDKITDGATRMLRTRQFQGDGVIDTWTEFCLVANYAEICKSEEIGKKNLAALLKEYPIYNAWLKDIKGIGPAMAAVLISEIDIHKAKYPSSLWKLAGLDVAEDGRGRSRRAEHLVSREYVTADGETKERNGVTFNPFLKTKLIGVLAGGFLKAGDNPYSRIYRDYKTRLENHAVYGLANEANRIAEFKAKGQKYAPKGHRHNMAQRYMIKRFLVDLYRAWRELEGLEVAPEYSEAKLGYSHAAKVA